LKITAIQPATALRGDEEVIKGKRSGSDTDGEIKVVADANDVEDVEPEEEDLYAYPTQFGEPAFRYVAGDGFLVIQLVRTFEGETARTVQIGAEFTAGRVQFVAGHSFREKSLRKAKALHHLVRRRFGGDGADHRREKEEEEGGGRHAQVLELD